MAGVVAEVLFVSFLGAEEEGCAVVSAGDDKGDVGCDEADGSIAAETVTEEDSGIADVGVGGVVDGFLEVAAEV